MKALALLIALIGVVAAEVFLDERFSDGAAWEKRWIQSTNKGETAGKFVLTHGKFYGDAEKDLGIQTSQDARFYGLSTKFKPFSNKDKPLVLQFTVKHEQNIDCGGGYVKLFDCSLQQDDMHGDSPYLIMFGPDICGPSNKKVHVIFNYKGKNHLIKKEIRPKDDVYTHLYTLIVKPDQTYEVLIDNEKVESGDLESDWDFLPAKTIKDPEAKKPEDWDDRAKIDDPEDVKPADWDVPEHIADPEAKKPEDWDDEMDGEWEPAMIDNPAFKGEWKPKQIDNPAYKGVWVHPEIDNPEYAPDATIGKYDESCIIGFDLWQVKAGTIFDNVLVTDDVAEAKKIGDELWTATSKAEKKMKEAQEEEERKKMEEEAKSKKEDNEDEDDEDEDDAEPSKPAAPAEEAEADSADHDEL
ncbi:calreticulin-like [Daphnia pulicaria]|uniref:calreticulin-like n=1 Tax=Daphnia pulicaria TaxID=35523 RepID=UPI001EEBF675|nr:calreticulin-like [Daphnia pulicaria]